MTPMPRYPILALAALAWVAGCASGSGVGEGPPRRTTAADTTPPARPVAIAVIAEPAGELPPVALAPGVTPAGLQERVRRFAPVELAFDESLLDREDRVVVARLVEASEILHGIFLEQVWRKNSAYRDALRSASGPGMDAAREYYAIMAGPWDRLEHDAPFLDVGPKPPGAGYYPDGLTSSEIEAYLAENPGMRESFTSYYTVIGRSGSREIPLVALPYSMEWREELERAAALLEQAAAHADNASLADFLRERAEAFRTNDYYASELAWMALEDNLIDPTIGPYEVYEDALMGWKGAFESFVTIRDPDASADLDVLVSHLPELEAALPLEDRYKRLDRSFASPLAVVDVIYTAGDARRGVQTIAFNLPNDPRVTEEHGTKKVMLRNVIDAKFDKILVPIAERVLEPDLVSEVGREAFFTFVVMHELAHGLGPREVADSGTAVSVALQTSYSAIEEAKADVVGVLSLAELTDAGVYTPEFRRQVYASAVAGLFRCVRFGTGEAHGKGCAVQMNHLLESGAIAAGEGGRFVIEFERIRPALEDLARTLLTIEATGDRAAAERLLAEKGSLPAAATAALERLGGVPVDIRPRYPAAERIAGLEPG